MRVQLIAFAAVGSGVAAALGAVLIRRLRRFRMRTQVLVIALASTITTAAGIVPAAAEMFISDHDLAVLAVVVVTSGPVSVGVALGLGSEYERSVQRVGSWREISPRPTGSTRRGLNAAPELWPRVSSPISQRN